MAKPRQHRQREALALLKQLAPLTGELQLLIPNHDAQARDWFEMFNDSATFMNRYFSKKKKSRR